MTNQLPNVALHGFNRLVAVNDLNASRFAFGEVAVALPDALIEFERLVFHSVEEFPASGAFQSDARVQINYKRQVRQAIADGKCDDAGHELPIKLPGHALIDRAGIVKPVADDNLIAGKGRAYDFPDELGAAGAEQEQFGFRYHCGGLFAVLEDVTNLFAYIRAARLTGEQYRPALASQPGRQKLDMRGLAAAFPAFKRDKCARPPHFSRVSRR